MSAPVVVVLDYGSADALATAATLERAGATVAITSERAAVMAADGMVVSGVGTVASTMRDLARVRGAELIDRRLAGGRAVLGCGVGMHLLFERSFPDAAEGLGEWPGELAAHEHRGWGGLDVAPASILLAGLESERFFFEHSVAALEWKLDVIPPFTQAAVSWGDLDGRFIAVVENGPLCATQFRPEDSGEAGVALLRNWLATL